MSTVSTNATTAIVAGSPDLGLVLTASNGHKIALYADLTASALMYRTSADGGATWSAATAAPTVYGYTATNLAAAQMIGDVVYLWRASVSGGPGIALQALPFDLTTSVLGTGTTSLLRPGAGASQWPQLDVAFDGSVFQVVSEIIYTAGGRSLVVCSVDRSGTVISQLDLGYSHSVLASLIVRQTPTTLFVTCYDSGRNLFVLLPVSRVAGSYSYLQGALETIYQPAAGTGPLYHSCLLNNDATLTFVVTNRGPLYAINRLNTRSYSQLIPLEGSISGFDTVHTAVDAASGDAFCLFTSAANGPSAIYMIRRLAGVWQPPNLFAGNGVTNAAYPASALVMTAGVADVLWTAGTVVSYGPLATSAAPLAPSNVGPTGTINTLTPLLSATPNPVAPGDPMSQREWKVVRTADSVVMLDTILAWSATLLYAGSALTYGGSYQTFVRDKDSLSAGGVGTWGPWSAAVTFTPQRGATVAINTVTCAATTSSAAPSTLTQPSYGANVTWTQADGHGGGTYRMTLLAADRSTIVDQSAWQTETPPIVTGASFDTIVRTPAGMHNGLAYYLLLEMGDATTGVISASTLWELDTSWTGPGPVTSLVATEDVANGLLTVSWVNPAGGASVLVEDQVQNDDLSWGPWVTIPTGGLITHVTVPQVVERAVTYRVTAINALGIAGPGTTVVATLPSDGIWLNYVSDITVGLRLAYMENYDSLKRDKPLDLQEWVPEGATKPLHSFGLRNDWIIGTSSSAKFFVPGMEVLDDGLGTLVDGDALVALIGQMVDSHEALLYRDRRFTEALVVRLVFYEDEPNADINTDVTVEIHETRFIGAIPVLTG